MAIQLCGDLLLKEMRNAVQGSSGLQGSRVGLRGHMELALDDIGLQTIQTVRSIIQKWQPHTLELLIKLATPEPRKENGVLVVRKTRPPDLVGGCRMIPHRGCIETDFECGQVSLEVISMLNFSHTKYARLQPAIRSIMLFANGASREVFNYGSRIAFCQSYNATSATLKRQSSERAEHLIAIGRDRTKGLSVRLDNVQEYAKDREHRIGRANVMKIGVAGTAVELFDFDPQAVSLAAREALLRKNERTNLTIEKLTEMIDAAHIEEVLILQWVETLVIFVPQLSHLKPEIEELYRTPDYTKMRVPDLKTILHPLGTSAKNETIMPELRDVTTDFLGQVGQTPDNYDKDYFMFWGGDGLTFERSLKMPEYMQFQDDTFKQFKHIVPFLEIWHTEWTYLSLVFETNWGDSLTADPSKLGHSATKIDQKAPNNLKKVDFYAGLYVAGLVFDVRMIDCFRYVISAESFVDRLILGI